MPVLDVTSRLEEASGCWRTVAISACAGIRRRCSQARANQRRQHQDTSSHYYSPAAGWSPPESRSRRRVRWCRKSRPAEDHPRELPHVVARGQVPSTAHGAVGRQRKANKHQAKEIRQQIRPRRRRRRRRRDSCRRRRHVPS